MFKQNLLSAAVLAACLGVAAPAVHASTTTITLDFDRLAACTDTSFPCNDLSKIDTDYGSVPGVLSLSWGSTDGQNQALVTDAAKWWSTQYGSLSGVAWGEGGDSHSLQVAMTALAGYSLASLSFEYAGWPNQNQVTQYGIYEADGTTPILSPITGLTAPGQGFATAAYTFTGSETAAVLRFGPNGYNAGIDNFKITLTNPTDPGTGQVPEPASLALLGIGLAGLGFMRRRRT